MKTKAVLLDKDGTLMEFDAFWRTASYGALEDLLRGLGGDLSAVGELLSALGVGNGATDITGALCCGTYKDMGQALYGVLKERGGNWTLEEITRRDGRGLPSSYIRRDHPPRLCRRRGDAAKVENAGNKAGGGDDRSGRRDAAMLAGAGDDGAFRRGLHR